MSSYSDETLAKSGGARTCARPRALYRRPAASESKKRNHDDLKTRVADRKRELITEIIEHKKNSSRYGAAEAIDKINRHLSELSQILNAGEWSNLREGTRLRLLAWIAR